MAAIKGIPAGITGTGRYIPERIMTNADFEKIMDTSDAWITERSGIKERHFAADDESCCDMAAKAALAALSDAGLSPDETDAVILSTNSPDSIIPCSAAKVQGMIGATNAGAFDVISGCTGSLTAMLTAISGVSCGLWKNVLVTGAERFNDVIDWECRSTSVLFGDGAGACVISRSEDREKRFVSGRIIADGGKYDLITAGLSGKQEKLKMKGRDVFKFVNSKLPPFIDDLCRDSGTTPPEIDFWVMHQANTRITESLFKRLDIPLDRTLNSIEKYGNTSSASMLINLDEAMKAGCIKPGDNIAFVAFGAGMTFGALLYAA